MSVSTQTPPPSRFALPQNIRQVLNRVARKQFLVRIANFPLLVLSILPLLWLGQALTDFAFTLSWVARLILLLGDAAVVGWLFYKHVIIPSRNRLNLRTSALLVERTFPQFRTSLISSVDFTSAGNGPLEKSAELIQLLISRVGRQVEQTDIMRGIISTRPLWRLVGKALAVILVVGGIIWYFHPKSFVLARRVFLSQESLPRRTTVIPLSKEFTLNTGSDVELSARALGMVPKNGKLVVVYPDGRSEVITATSSDAEPAVFSVTLRNVLQPFRYHFEINDGASPEFKVSTRTLPSLASTRFVQYLPPYTNRPPTELSAGSLTLLAEGRLVIEAESTQALKSATLELKGLKQNIRMDSGDPIANLRLRVEAGESKMAELKAQVEKLTPPFNAATEDAKAAKKILDDAQKAKGTAKDGDEKRKLDWEWEKAANADNKARGEAEFAHSAVERTQRELDDMQRQTDGQKKELEKAQAAQKAPDKETADKQKRILRAEIPVPKEGLTGLSIHLVNEEGLASENDPVYRVNIILDKPPTVELSEPKSDRKTVLPGDKVRLKFSVRDDFGIERLTLKYVILRPDIDGNPAPAEQGSIPLPYPAKAPNVSSEYLWPLSSFVPPLMEGCSVSYWIEAADYYTLYSPGAGISRKMSLIVVSQDDKKKELIEEMGKAAIQIENLSQRQGKTNEKTNSSIRK